MGFLECRVVCSSVSSFGLVEGLGVVSRMFWGIGSCSVGFKVGMGLVEGFFSFRFLVSRFSRVFLVRFGVGARVVLRSIVVSLGLMVRVLGFRGFLLVW